MQLGGNHNWEEFVALESSPCFPTVHSLRPSRDEEEHATSRVDKFPPVVAEHRTHLFHVDT